MCRNYLKTLGVLIENTKYVQLLIIKTSWYIMEHVGTKFKCSFMRELALSERFQR